MGRRGGKGIIGAHGQELAVVGGGDSAEAVCLEGERGAGDVEEADLVGGGAIAGGVNGIGFKEVGALQGRQGCGPIAPSTVELGWPASSRCR